MWPKRNVFVAWAETSAGDPAMKSKAAALQAARRRNVLDLEF
jgi:hypothetical protein